MTKFIDGSKKSEPKKEVRKTVFTHYVISDRKLVACKVQPENYDNVEFLFHDMHYGDVFKTWDNNWDEKHRSLFFGTKGDEDYE